MKLNKDNSIIYIASPANAATGGPFLLHQLAYKLICLGFRAKMFYPISEKDSNPVHEFYKHFNLPFTLNIDDNSNNLIIISESFPDLVYKYKSINKVIWWLSVDNYPGFEGRKRSFSLKRFLGIKKTYSLYKKQPKHSHWVQSHYAKNYLSSRGISKIDFLSDFLDPIFLTELKDKIFNNQTKENIVAYNPKKGFEVTQKLILTYPEIAWIPIENMTPKEVKDLLLRAKVYIDFGNHPGKDRIPREAAMCGCIIITNKKGSANFYQDVPILEEYKFEYTEQNENKIIEKIKTSFLEFDSKINDFKNYKLSILAEESKFDDDLNKITNDLFKL
ncbi:hypothetical protein [Flavobacterium faecale]|uniref:hypothetical protein n=1 Tax=Flavobacterium faecale TaxID=1355330 RepID=UPI003AACF09A